MSLKDALQPLLDILSGQKSLVEPIIKKSLDFTSGLENELQNPDPFLREKRKDVSFYDEMLTDDRIRSIAEIKKRCILSTPYDFKPAGETELDRIVCDEVKDQLTTLKNGQQPNPFDDVLDNFLDASSYGFKVGEKLWCIQDSKIVLHNIRIKHSLFFDFGYDEYGGFEKLWIGRYYGSPGTEVCGPTISDKFMIFVYPYAKNGNMYGEPDLGRVFPQYYAKRHLFNMRNERMEQYGKPIPHAVYDSATISPSEKKELEESLQKFHNNKSFLVPGIRHPETKELLAKVAITLLEASNNQASTDYENAISQIDRQIARAMLIPDKIGYTDSEGGSYALGEVHFDVFKMIISDAHRKLENLVQPVIDQIVNYNFAGAQPPKFEFAKLSEKIEGTVLKILLDGGVVDPREPWIRRYVGIPTLTQLERQQMELLPKPTVKQPTLFTATLKKKDPPFDSERARETFDQNEMDFVRQYNELMAEQENYVIRKIQEKKIIEKRDLSLIDSLKIDKTSLRSLFETYYSKLYLNGLREAKREADPRMKRATEAAKLQSVEEELDDAGDTWLSKEWIDNYLAKYGINLSKKDKDYLNILRDRAYFITGQTESRVVKDIFEKMSEGFRAGMMGDQIIQGIRDALKEDRKQYATTIARTNQSDAYNSGRMNYFLRPEVDQLIEAYQYSAILDDQTTDFCAAHNGQIILKTDPEFGRIVPPNHYNCRSTLIPIFIGENELPGDYFYGYQDDMQTWGTGVPKDERKPADGFGG